MKPDSALTSSDSLTLEENLPEPSRMVHALGQIGYRLEDAISDLIDNAITAGATKVLVRFLHDGADLVSISIADDGCGMTERQLHNAMRFGSPEDKRDLTLGKFGMGLKLASLSHSSDFTVASRRGNKSHARRWAVENIAAGWLCERVERKIATEILNTKWADLDLSASGTIVTWNNLKDFPVHKKGLRSALSLVERRLRLHLGLTFHRFIESGRLQIKLDQQTVGHQVKRHHVILEPLNPFSYPTSGHQNYPLSLQTMDIPGVGTIEMEAHIWPPNSEEPAYKLGKRAASHQGFYIYRNDRLIQAGGWNGVVNDESEPHSSLARVRIDLPAELDDFFGLNVQKSAVVTPIGFADAVTSAVSNKGSGWEDFRHHAISTYRSAGNSGASKRLFPGDGFPRQVKQRYAESTGKPVVLTIRRSAEKLICFDEENAVVTIDQSVRDQFKGNQNGWITFTLILFQLLSKTSLSKTRHALRSAILEDLTADLASILH